MPNCAGKKLLLIVVILIVLAIIGVTVGLTTYCFRPHPGECCCWTYKVETVDCGADVYSSDIPLSGGCCSQAPDPSINLCSNQCATQRSSDPNTDKCKLMATLPSVYDPLHKVCPYSQPI